ncbi:trypsin-like peptidase domain-containing protein [Anatilimnocola floriformis]|uniref:trypsin-like peptidase domain-containing protein n=1 Tax=Anatilimnocola floriformis TaxID=2948575 RepID=UPI0020C294E2|nr:trypsin-like peptidase domain-containing protein [Anatilimnocola floriformis]
MSAFPALILLALCSADADTVLVQFHSTKCGPCRAMHPVVEQLNAAGYPLQKVDVDEQPQYAEQFKIRSLPTFALFSRGREVNRVEGSSNFNELSGLFHSVGYRPSGATQQVAAQPPAAQQPLTNSEVQYTSAPAGPVQQQPSQMAQMQPAPANYNAPVAQPAARGAAGISPQQRAGWATVRLKVEDSRYSDFATGTIIDCHEDEALVLTCGHVFRDSKGQAKITVDLFAPGATRPVEGTLLTYEAEDRDIALVSIHPGVAIEPAPIAPAGYAVQPRDRVFTIGCDKGAAPSLRNSFITPNRYMGAPRFTADGAPVEGRSGGGLFTESGLLIGVCNSANAKENHGLYAALATVHGQLDQMNLSAIYQKDAGKVAAASFEQSIAPPAPAPLPNMPATMPNSLSATMPRNNVATMPRNNVATMPRNNVATMPPANYAAPTAPPSLAGQDDSEVIVIVRSKSNPAKQSEIFMLDRPPAEVIRILQTDARLAPRGSSQDLLRSASRLGQPGGMENQPVVRGQSQ